MFKAEHRSCVAAVVRVAVLMVALHRRVSSDTGAYCRACAKLPEVVLERLAVQLADRCEETAPSAWLWRGRHVHLVDGTTLSTPDTLANQAAWPQPTSQEQGLGFPLIRIVVLLSLATALLTGMAMGKYAGKETGETALFRSLLEQLPRGDIFVADRYLCSYFMIALARARRRCGRAATSAADHGFSPRPVPGQRRSSGTLAPPATTHVDGPGNVRADAGVPRRAQLRVHVHQPGFRTETLVVVTTLTDHRTYSAQDIAALYHKRWLVELDIRAIKVSLGIDVLRCRSPHMVRKEIWTALLAYNLIRKTILEAAYDADVSPRELSFTAAMQAIAAGWTAILLLDDAGQMRLVDLYLHNLAGYPVGHRPDRIEPRPSSGVRNRIDCSPHRATRRDGTRASSLVGGHTESVRPPHHAALSGDFHAFDDPDVVFFALTERCLALRLTSPHRDYTASHALPFMRQDARDAPSGTGRPNSLPYKLQCHSSMTVFVTLCVFCRDWR